MDFDFVVFVSDLVIEFLVDMLRVEIGVLIMFFYGVRLMGVLNDGVVVILNVGVVGVLLM